MEQEKAENDRKAKEIEDEILFDKWCSAIEPYQHVNHMCRNGNSLFASIAACVYGDSNQDMLVRQEIVKFLHKK
jgi:hypothetical protein